jgi:hypothetical protein
MGEVVDIVKLLERLGKRESAGAKTSSAISAEEAIHAGMAQARKEEWVRKFGTQPPSGTTKLDPMQLFRDAARKAELAGVDTTPSAPTPPPAPPAPPPEPPPVRVQIIPHPSSEEQVVAPSQINDRQALVDAEVKQMARYKLNESAYMSGSITHDQYMEEFKKIFPDE